MQLLVMAVSVADSMTSELRSIIAQKDKEIEDLKSQGAKSSRSNYLCVSLSGEYIRFSAMLNEIGPLECV